MEESEREEWQEVISRKDTTTEQSLSSVTGECGKQSRLNFQEIIEVKDKWVTVRSTMDSGAARHVMIQGMFLRMRLERKTAPKKFVAATGAQIRDLGEKTIPFMTNERDSQIQNIHECERGQTSHINAECRPSWQNC